MAAHFAQVAPQYDELRVTDMAPLRDIATRLPARPTVADVGCGTGRYGLRLIEAADGLVRHLVLVDASHAMLQAQHARWRPYWTPRVTSALATSGHLPLRDASVDAVVTFNAVHHFSPVGTFLREASRILRPGGLLAIYTRTRSQNRRTVWGQHFPGFAAKETRLFEIGELERRIAGLSLEAEAVVRYRYRREASLARLLAQARAHHYSTFALYRPDEFACALGEFGQRVRAAAPDLNRVAWHDENTLLLARKG